KPAHGKEASGSLCGDCRLSGLGMLPCQQMQQRLRTVQQASPHNNLKRIFFFHTNILYHFFAPCRPNSLTRMSQTGGTARSFIKSAPFFESTPAPSGFVQRPVDAWR